MSRQDYDGIHIIRVVSCFMVVLVHVAAIYFYKFSPVWNAATFYNCFSRTCVPLFLMITGYLLMDRQDGVLPFYRKRSAKILIPLLFYSVGYYLVSKRPWSGFIDALVSGPIEFHLWYMYVLCGLYFALPFLQKIWAGSTDQEKQFLIGAWFILYCVFPTLSAFSIFSYNPAQVFSLSLPELWGYAFIGAYLREAPKLHGLLSLLMYAIPSFCIFYATYKFSSESGTPSMAFMSNTSVFTVLAAIGIFMALRDWKIRWARTWMLQVSHCSFGIYLIHILLMGQIRKRLPEDFFNLPPWIMLPLFSLLVFFCSFAIIYPLKQFKFSQRFVG